MDQPIVVVTGANRGIGFEICRQLCERGARVVLTARDPATGAAAVKRLVSQGHTAEFQLLEVTSEESVGRWASIWDGRLGDSMC